MSTTGRQAGIVFFLVCTEVGIVLAILQYKASINVFFISVLLFLSFTGGAPGSVPSAQYTSTNTSRAVTAEKLPTDLDRSMGGGGTGQDAPHAAPACLSAEEAIQNGTSLGLNRSQVRSV